MEIEPTSERSGNEVDISHVTRKRALAALIKVIYRKEYEVTKMISYFVTSTSLLFNSSTSPLTSLILLSYSWSFKPFASSNSSTFLFISLCLDRSSSSCFDVNNSSFSSARILSLFSSNPLLNCWTYSVFEGRKIRLTIRFYVSSIYKKNTQALYALPHSIY